MDDRARLSFLDRRLGPAFELQEVEVPPGGDRAYEEAEWRDALVVVERGAVELECQNGASRTFVRGDVLCLSGLPLRALRNPGDIPALLAAVSRRRRPSAPAAGGPGGLAPGT
jgi:hypothetical protein